MPAFSPIQKKSSSSAVDGVGNPEGCPRPVDSREAVHGPAPSMVVVVASGRLGLSRGGSVFIECAVEHRERSPHIVRQGPLHLPGNLPGPIPRELKGRQGGVPLCHSSDWFCLGMTSAGGPFGGHLEGESLAFERLRLASCSLLILACRPLFSLRAGTSADAGSKAHGLTTMRASFS